MFVNFVFDVDFFSFPTRFCCPYSFSVSIVGMVLKASSLNTFFSFFSSSYRSKFKGSPYGETGAFTNSFENLTLKFLIDLGFGESFSISPIGFMKF